MSGQGLPRRLWLSLRYAGKQYQGSRRRALTSRVQRPAWASAFVQSASRAATPLPTPTKPFIWPLEVVIAGNKVAAARSISGTSPFLDWWILMAWAISYAECWLHMKYDCWSSERPRQGKAAEEDLCWICRIARQLYTTLTYVTITTLVTWNNSLKQIYVPDVKQIYQFIMQRLWCLYVIVYMSCRHMERAHCILRSRHRSNHVNRNASKQPVIVSFDRHINIHLNLWPSEMAF